MNTQGLAAGISLKVFFFFFLRGRLWHSSHQLMLIMEGAERGRVESGGVALTLRAR